MRKLSLSLCAGILLAVGSATSALAAPPDKFTEPATFIFPDFELGLVVFINMDRATYCTAERVAWEEDFLAWLDGGEIGDPPELPAEPDGFAAVSFKQHETGQGAIVDQVRGSGLAAEVWEMDADAPGIGPCTDSDGADHLIGAGTARLIALDNDLGSSGTRGNSFGNRGVINLVGDAVRYSFMFHVNSRCHFVISSTVCEVQGTSLR